MRYICLIIVMFSCGNSQDDYNCEAFSKKYESTFVELDSLSFCGYNLPIDGYHEISDSNVVFHRVRVELAGAEYKRLNNHIFTTETMHHLANVKNDLGLVLFFNKNEIDRNTCHTNCDQLQGFLRYENEGNNIYEYSVDLSTCEQKVTKVRNLLYSKVNHFADEIFSSLDNTHQILVINTDAKRRTNN